MTYFTDNTFFIEGIVFILSMSIRGAVLTAGMLVFERLAGDRISAGYRRIAWLAIAIMFMIQPWFSFINIESPPKIVETPVVMPQNAELPQLPSVPEPMSVNTIDNAAAPAPGFLTICKWKIVQASQFLYTAACSAQGVFYSLIGGAAAIMLLILLCNLRFYRQIAKLKPLENPQVTALIEKFARELNIKRKIILLESNEQSVSTFGLIRPKILFPKRSRALSEDELSFIILHELYHIKNKDIVFSYLYMLVIALHWFNPFSYVAFRRCRQAIESNCDEAVIRRTGMTKYKDYGLTLIKILENSSLNRRFVLNAGICENKKSLKERIISMKFISTRTKFYAAAFSLLFGTVFLSAVCFSGVACASPAEKAQVKTGTESATTEAKPLITINTSYILIKNMNIKKNPILAKSLNSDNFAIVDSLRSIEDLSGSDITIVSQPKVATVSGSAAVIRMIRHTKPGPYHSSFDLDYKNPDIVGCSFQVLPEYLSKEDAVKLHFAGWGKPDPKNKQSFTKKWKVDKDFTITEKQQAIIKVPVTPEESALLTVSVSVVPQVSVRMRNIIFPKVDFKDANVNSVASYLNQASKRYDPYKKGVTIIGFNPRIADKLPRVTASFDHFPLDEILRYLGQQLNLTYVIEGEYVVLRTKESLLRSSDQNEADAIKQKADVLYKQRKYKEAADIRVKILDLKNLSDDDKARLCSPAIYEYAMAKNYDKANNLYTKLSSMKLSQPLTKACVVTYKANALKLEKKYDEAIALFNSKPIEIIDGDNSPRYMCDMMKIFTYRDKKDYKSIINDFPPNYIKQFRPVYQAEYYRKRAEAWKNMGKNSEAIKEYEDSIKILPLGKTFYQLGLLFEAQKQPEKARQMYQKSIDKYKASAEIWRARYEKSPISDNAYNMNAQLVQSYYPLVKLGRKAEARANLEKVLNIKQARNDSKKIAKDLLEKLTKNKAGTSTDLWKDGSREARRALKGQIAEVNRKYGFVLVDLGSKSRVKQFLTVNKVNEVNPKISKGCEMTVARRLASGNSEYLGKIKLVKIHDNYSIANVVGPVNKPLRIGDPVYFSDKQIEAIDGNKGE